MTRAIQQVRTRVTRTSLPEIIMTRDTKDLNKELRKKEARDANRDPLTKTPGAHPIGTGIGAAAGGAAGIAGGIAASAATGAATGTLLGGPAGAVVGLAAGALAGGLAGKAIGEAVNPTEETLYWRESYQNEPYYNVMYTFDDYDPAYRAGYEGYNRYYGKTFDEAEKDIEQDFNRIRGGSRLSWRDARAAARSAWDRLTGNSHTMRDSRNARDGASRPY